MNKPKKGGAKIALSVRLPDRVRAILDEIAETQMREHRLKGEVKNVYASDVVREAIQAYLLAHGYDADVEVDRGGWRERKED